MVFTFKSFTNRLIFLIIELYHLISKNKKNNFLLLLIINMLMYMREFRV